MGMRIAAVEYFLPHGRLTNEDLSVQFPEWSVDKISSKTGIVSRHIAASDEYSSDLAVGAGRKLMSAHEIDPEQIDYLIVCSQTSDYFLPSLASLVQDRLGLRTSTGAVDVNLGCSGYVYALGLAKGLIESRQASRILVITSDTYSKLLNPGDKSVRTIFGDGASATLVEVDNRDDEYAVVYGTDGSGAKNLMVPKGGLRDGHEIQPAAEAGARNLITSDYDLYMNGPEIFNFTLRVVPNAVDQVLNRANVELDQIDLFVFHQANAFMMEHLRKKLGVPKEKFVVDLAETGNTVSSTIPIALSRAIDSGVLLSGMRVMLVGFGVGLSWAGMTLRW